LPPTVSVVRNRKRPSRATRTSVEPTGSVHTVFSWSNCVSFVGTWSARFWYWYVESSGKNDQLP
jgi:hypothetical protein